MLLNIKSSAGQFYCPTKIHYPIRPCLAHFSVIIPYPHSSHLLLFSCNHSSSARAEGNHHRLRIHIPGLCLECLQQDENNTCTCMHTQLTDIAALDFKPGIIIVTTWQRNMDTYDLENKKNLTIQEKGIDFPLIFFCKSLSSKECKCHLQK